ncbi:MAG: hypothetical protein IT580_09205 [Verrucomicrobiales bacterium]|nr:hypothetical protein [Verrucomicrobiales bacterium]
MKHRTRPLRLAPAVLLLALPVTLHAAPLFEDSFDTDTSANWTIKTGYFEGSATDDYSAEWGVDYSQLKYKFYTAIDTFEELAIPAAPSSTGTATKALKLSVNKKDDLAERFAINLYPKGKTFSGDYVVKFDLFMNHGAFTDNGVGTTEYALFGINHGGEYSNWFALSGTGLSDPFKTTAVGRDNSDGLFFGVTSEGGAARDYVALDGGGAGLPPVPRLADGSGGLLDRNGDGTLDTNDPEGFFTTVFHSSQFEGPGMLGKRWVRVEVSQVNNVVTWKMDGHLFAQRTNDTAFKSGTLMLGLSDPFTSIADPRDETFVLIDNLRVEPVRTVVVDTADNGSTAADGKTSLAEALANQQENDRIVFNIPGEGPHTLATPIGGYALITKDGITIDGYTQPGASPNTKGILEGNDAKLRIVLDSTSDATSGSAEKPDRASTRLPFPGYGDSENAILGVYGADQVTIRGLSFKSRHTPGSDEDPSIYCVALVNQAQNARVQGCWFGLAPDGRTVSGGGAAVAGFRHRVSVDGANVDTYSGGLIYGTDSDGRNDIGEGNIATGMHIALALELPRARVSGNYFNLLADGKTWVNVNDVHQAQLDAGREAGDSSVENYENGRETTASVIGVDGDGVNDANERNILNTTAYDTLIEFYSNANGCVIAGNHFGVATDGVTLAPKRETEDPNLISLPGTASIRFGSNGDGVSDTLEGNIVANIPGVQMISANNAVPITARGNQLSGNNFSGFPFADGSGRTYEEYYANVLVAPATPQPTIVGLANNVLTGTLPAFNTDNYATDVVDLYVIDPVADANAYIIPGRYLGSFTDNSTNDTDQTFGSFSVDVTALNVPGGSKIAIVATYTKDADRTEAGRSVTGPPSAPFAVPGVAGPGSVRVARSASGLTVSWDGSLGGRLQSAPAITGPWADVAGAATPYAVTANTVAAFYRLAK